MAIRENLNENPATAVKLTAVLVLLAAGLLGWYLWPSKAGVDLHQEFYSDDDGKTWFADTEAKVVPFDHNGKQAVLAKVYLCADGTKFVGYLQKYSDPAKQQVMETKKVPSGGGHGITAAKQLPDNGILVKRPGDATWVPDQDDAAATVKMIACPHGGKDFMPLLPK